MMLTLYQLYVNIPENIQWGVRLDFLKGFSLARGAYFTERELTGMLKKFL